MSTTSKLSVSRNKGNGVVARIFFLDLGGGRVLSANPDGSDLKTLLIEGRKLPDGLAVDVAAGHLYWTNMGNPKANDGTIFRSDLDGSNLTTIVAAGGTFTPKQLQIDKPNGKLYWCDREGMRVMRANLDGSNIETLVDTSQGDPRPGADASKWCVGIAVDADAGKLYWTQKGDDNAGEGSILRTNLEITKGQTPSNRTDPLYQGVVVSKETIPSPSSIARSNLAAPAELATSILPDTVSIGFSVGGGSEPAPEATPISARK